MRSVSKVLVSFAILAILGSSAFAAGRLACVSLLTGQKLKLKDIAQEVISLASSLEHFEKKLSGVKQVQAPQEQLPGLDYSQAPHLWELKQGKNTIYVLRFKDLVVDGEGQKISLAKFRRDNRKATLVRVFELPYRSNTAAEVVSTEANDTNPADKVSGAFLEPGAEKVLQSSGNRRWSTLEGSPDASRGNPARGRERGFEGGDHRETGNRPRPTL